MPPSKVCPQCETKAESVLLVSAVQGFCCFCSLLYTFRYVFVNACASSSRTCKNSSAHPRPNISAEGLHFCAFSLVKYPSDPTSWDSGHVPNTICTKVYRKWSRYRQDYKAKQLRICVLIPTRCLCSLFCFATYVRCICFLQNISHTTHAYRYVWVRIIPTYEGAIAPLWLHPFLWAPPPLVHYAYSGSWAYKPTTL